jgi:hypothetical protein
MKQRFSKFRTLLLAAGSVLVVGTAIAVAKRVGGQTTQQFMLFQNLKPGADPMEVARKFMGPEVVKHEGFFSCDFRIPGNPDIIGMVS